MQQRARNGRSPHAELTDGKKQTTNITIAVSQAELNEMEVDPAKLKDLVVERLNHCESTGAGHTLESV